MEPLSVSSLLIACVAAAVSSAVTWQLARRSSRKASASALALRESEERLRLANEAAGIGTFTLDLEGGRALYSPELAAILGFPHVQHTSIEAAMARVHRDDEAWVRAKFKAAAGGADGGQVKMDFRFVLPGGEVRWMTWLGRVLFREAAFGRQEALRMVGGCLDITERKRDDERIRLLMREVNHRSKNMLALAQAVARQTMGSDPSNFLERFEERIRALAATQDLLVKDQWKGVDLGELAHFQLAHFGNLLGTRIEIRGNRLRLPPPPLRLWAWRCMSLPPTPANTERYLRRRAASNWRGPLPSTTRERRRCRSSGASEADLRWRRLPRMASASPC